MVQKPDRGRYLVLEDVRISYNHKKNAINITSSDPDIPNGSFHMVLNKGTESEEALRSLLTEHNLIKQEVIPVESQLDMFSQTTSTFAQHLASDIRVGCSKNIALVGSPGSGKSFLLNTLAYYSSVMGSTVIHVEGRDKIADLIDLNLKKVNIINIEGVFGILNPLNEDSTSRMQFEDFVSMVNSFIRFQLPEENHVAAEKLVLQVAMTLSVLNKLNVTYLVEALKSINQLLAATIIQALNHAMSLPNSNLFFGEGESLTSKIKEGYLNLINVEPVRQYPYGLSLALSIEEIIMGKLKHFAFVHDGDSLPILISVDDLPQKVMEEAKWEVSQDETRNLSFVSSFQTAGDIPKNHSFTDIVLFRSNYEDSLWTAFPHVDLAKTANTFELCKTLKIGEAFQISPSGDIVSKITPDKEDKIGLLKILSTKYNRSE